jgi:ABC-2 type transport system permease protein
MIILSDGDIMRNHVKGVGENKQSLALGFDRFTKQTFGNKEFLLNCVNYLTGHEVLMAARSKEYKLRLLNQAKIKEHQLKWQLINVLLPVISILLIAFGANVWRKYKFTK